MKSLTNVSDRNLLVEQNRILEELRRRKILRSGNNPISDYAEWLVSTKLKLTLLSSSNKGFDAVDAKKKIKYQIKSRRPNERNKSRQLGVMRNLEQKEFDFLIGVIFSIDYQIKEVYKIPHHIVKKYAKESEHQNGHILHLKGSLLKDKGVQNISKKIQD